MDKPTTLQKLQAVETRGDLATLLGFSPRGLTYIIYKVKEEKKYSHFSVPKKSGGNREIAAPIESLKLLQRRLSDLLQKCQDDITEKNQPHRHLSHGFRKNHSIFTNALRHKGRRNTLNIDLEDFFGSFNFGRVRGFFIKDQNFLLKPSVATIIAQIACHKNSLPQGSPSSPVITNLIFHIIDLRLHRLASKNKCTYTRYADDLTFSTNQKFFPEDIAAPSNDNFDSWNVGKKLRTEIEKSGFSINQKKVRMQYPGSRMETTGLTNNQKVNTKKEYRLKTRAMVNNFIKSEKVTIDNEYDPNKKEDFKKIKKKLFGRLSHIYNIDRLTKEEQQKNQPQKKRKEERTPSREKTFRDFLFFTVFAKASNPIVLCEGTTDSIYLNCALKNLHLEYKNLKSKDNSIKVDFFRYSKTKSQILKLGGGTAPLREFITSYTNFIERTPTQGLDNPIIILVDNDKGGKAVFSQVKEMLNLEEAVDGSQDFYRIKYNLYLVATPKVNEKETCIEDFFKDDALKEKVNGKIFSKENKYEKEKNTAKVFLQNA